MKSKLFFQQEQPFMLKILKKETLQLWFICIIIKNNPKIIMASYYSLNCRKKLIILNPLKN